MDSVLRGKKKMVRYLLAILQLLYSPKSDNFGQLKPYNPITTAQLDDGSEAVL